MPGHEKDIIARSVAADGYANIKGKVLVNEENGWDDYVLRKFEVQNEGHSESMPMITNTLCMFFKARAR